MFVVGRRLASVAAATAATAASLACASENEGLTPTLKQIAEERRQSMPERIILVRHGESEANADHTLWRTKADNALVLTDKGHAQARKAGERIRLLTGDAPVGFFCSPFARTIQTMRGIQAAWGERKANVRARSQGGTNWVSIEPQIREQEFGNLQGDEHRLYREEQKKVGRFFYRFPTGESGADVYDRTKTWMRNDLLTVNTGVDGAPVDNVVVVTHGLTMRLILMNASPQTFETIWNPDNCNLWVLTKDLSMKSLVPYRISKEEGDPVASSRNVGVRFRDGTTRSLMLDDYINIPTPRSRQLTVVSEMLAKQHGLDPETIAAYDIHDGRLGDVAPLRRQYSD